jgi:hypothetical protein
MLSFRLLERVACMELMDVDLVACTRTLIRRCLKTIYTIWMFGTDVVRWR